jgi:hypothetical protein
MKSHVTLLAFAFTFAAAATAATAQDTPQRSFEDALVAEDGMTQVGDGLYANVGGAGESYVATNAAGRKALLAKLVALRAKLASRGGATSHSPTGRIGFLDGLIADMAKPVPKDEYRNGSCGGTGTPLTANATSHFGVNASGTATNSNGAYNTTNYAFAGTYDNDDNVTSQQSSTTHGTTTASAAAAASQGSTACDSFGTATVTCPGSTTPAIIAVAHTYHQGNTCLQ